MMPTFILLGAPRSGTTSVYHYLRQHPAIVMSFIKETQFFTYLASRTLADPVVTNVPWPARSLNEYQALFEAREGVKAVGEATPMYMYVPGVPGQIKALVPDVRLFCILRNPVERAYSGYLKNIREGVEDRTFEQAIRDELSGKSTIVQSQNYYVRTGLYYGHLLRFLEHFDRGRFCIYFYDDLLRSPREFMHTMFTDLGIDPDFLPDTSIRFNRGGIPPIKKDPRMNAWKPLILRVRRLLPPRHNLSLYRFQMWMQEKILKVPPMSRATGDFLRDLYVDDIRQLQQLTGRDLAGWLGG